LPVCLNIRLKKDKNEIARHVARRGERRGVYGVLVERLKEKRQLGRPRRRWEDNIIMDHQEVGCGGMDWMELAQDMDRLL